MNDRIYRAFDAIHAEEEIKQRTRTALARRTYRKASAFRCGGLALAACLVLVFLGWGGWQAYLRSAVTISIDVNPSLELGINLFDQVVSVRGRNADGERLAEALEIRFMNYAQAVEEIFSQPAVAAMLSGDEVMTIAVVGEDESRCQRLLAGVESCAAGRENTYCYAANVQDLAEAHALGLSYGKYRAYLELQALDPLVQPEEVREMCMREIRDRIQALSDPGNGGEANGKNANGGAGWRRGRAQAASPAETIQ